MSDSGTIIYLLGVPSNFQGDKEEVLINCLCATSGLESVVVDSWVKTNQTRDSHTLKILLKERLSDSKLLNRLNRPLLIEDSPLQIVVEQRNLMFNSVSYVRYGDFQIINKKCNFVKNGSSINDLLIRYNLTCDRCNENSPWKISGALNDLLQFENECNEILSFDPAQTLECKSDLQMMGIGNNCALEADSKNPLQLLCQENVARVEESECGLLSCQESGDLSAKHEDIGDVDYLRKIELQKKQREVFLKHKDLRRQIEMSKKRHILLKRNISAKSPHGSGCGGDSTENLQRIVVVSPKSTKFVKDRLTKSRACKPPILTYQKKRWRTKNLLTLKQSQELCKIALDMVKGVDIDYSLHGPPRTTDFDVTSTTDAAAMRERKRISRYLAVQPHYQTHDRFYQSAVVADGSVAACAGPPLQQQPWASFLSVVAPSLYAGESLPRASTELKVTQEAANPILEPFSNASMTSASTAAATGESHRRQATSSKVEVANEKVQRWMDTQPCTGLLERVKSEETEVPPILVRVVQNY